MIQIYKFPYRGEWRVATEARIKQLEEGKADDRKSAKEIREMWDQYQKNRLSFFLPHGPKLKAMVKQPSGVLRNVIQRDKIPHCGAGTTGAEFINNTEQTFTMFLKVSQGGGTCHGMIFSLVRCVKCDPDWMCFTDHGLKHIPYTGPKDWLITADSWNKMQRIWREYLTFIPEYELEKRHYAIAHTLRHGHIQEAPPLLVSGTVFHFCSYSQWHHRALSGKQLDGGQWDEQMPEEMADEYFERLSTRRIVVDGETVYQPQTCATLTGHVQEGNPDTGGGGWLKTKMYDGRDMKGTSIAVYQMPGWYVPDEIIDRKTKQEKYERGVVIPKQNNDKHAERIGRARWFAEWEMVGGLVIDRWDPAMHWIDPFEIPKDWTLYRAIDYGKNKPTAALWAAVSPDFDLFFYREYYTTSLSVGENAANIVEVSGNKRRALKTDNDPRLGETWTTFEEIMCGEEFFDSVLDSRSFGTPSDRGMLTIGQLYNDYGCYCRKASGKQNRTPEGDGALDLLNNWFEVNPNRRHYVTKKPGAARIYVFNTLKHFRDEIETLQEGKRLDTQQDHLICCAKWIVLLDPSYMGHKQPRDIEDRRVSRRPRARFTNY